MIRYFSVKASEKRLAKRLKSRIEIIIIANSPVKHNITTNNAIVFILSWSVFCGLLYVKLRLKAISRLCPQQHTHTLLLYNCGDRYVVQPVSLHYSQKPRPVGYRVLSPFWNRKIKFPPLLTWAPPISHQACLCIRNTVWGTSPHLYLPFPKHDFGNIQTGGILFYLTVSSGMKRYWGYIANENDIKRSDFHGIVTTQQPKLDACLSHAEKSLDP